MGRVSSEAVTRGIRVIAEPSFSPDHSAPAEGRYVFAYRILIANESEVTVQLMSRHWIIIDSDGEVNEVRGPGVVGETPVLEPGRSFEYTSFCPLGTDFGTMEGTFSFRQVNPPGELFDVEIARFYLAAGAGTQAT